MSCRYASIVTCIGTVLLAWCALLFITPTPALAGPDLLNVSSPFEVYQCDWINQGATKDTRVYARVRYANNGDAPSNSHSNQLRLTGRKINGTLIEQKDTLFVMSSLGTQQGRTNLHTVMFTGQTDYIMRGELEYHLDYLGVIAETPNPPGETNNVKTIGFTCPPGGWSFTTETKDLSNNSLTGIQLELWAYDRTDWWNPPTYNPVPNVSPSQLCASSGTCTCTSSAGTCTLLAPWNNYKSDYFVRLVDPTGSYGENSASCGGASNCSVVNNTTLKWFFDHSNTIGLYPGGLFTLAPAWTFTGQAFLGSPPTQSSPISGLLMTLSGSNNRNSGYVVLANTNTLPNGSYDLKTTTLYNYYRIIDGNGGGAYSQAAAQAGTGCTVINNSTIRCDSPTSGIHGNNLFWLTALGPTPTPSRTPTPTNSPTPIPTSTPTPTNTLTPTPTPTPTSGPTPTPTPVPTCSVVLSPDPLILNSGTTGNLTAATTESNGSIEEVRFSSNRLSVALGLTTPDTSSPYSTGVLSRNLGDAIITAEGVMGGVVRCSDTSTVTVTCDATAPTNLNATNITQTSATLNWIPGTGGASQRIYIDDNLNDILGGCPEIPSCLFRDNNLSPTTSTYNTGNILTPGVTYYWRVKTHQSDFCWVDTISSFNSASPQQWTFTGNIYLGNPSDTSTPVGNRPIRLTGGNSGPVENFVELDSEDSDVNGTYTLTTISSYNTFYITGINTDGWQISGGQPHPSCALVTHPTTGSVTGIQCSTPPVGVYSNNNFWAIPSTPFCSISFPSDPINIPDVNQSINSGDILVNNQQNGTISEINFSLAEPTFATLNPSSDSAAPFSTTISSTDSGSTTLTAEAMMNGVAQCTATTTVDIACPVAPSTNLAATNITQNSATLTWTPGTGGSSQHLYISDNLTDLNECWYPGQCIVASVPADASSYPTDAVFAPDTIYFWKIITFSSTHCWVTDNDNAFFRTSGFPPATVSGTAYINQDNTCNPTTNPVTDQAEVTLTQLYPSSPDCDPYQSSIQPDANGAFTLQSSGCFDNSNEGAFRLSIEPLPDSLYTTDPNCGNLPLNLNGGGDSSNNNIFLSPNRGWMQGYGGSIYADGDIEISLPPSHQLIVPESSAGVVTAGGSIDVGNGTLSTPNWQQGEYAQTPPSEISLTRLKNITLTYVDEDDYTGHAPDPLDASDGIVAYYASQNTILSGNWTDLNVPVIVFVEGDLTIPNALANQQITLGTSGFLLLAATGDIIVEDTIVTQADAPVSSADIDLQGIFISGHNFTVQGTGNPETNKRIHIKGVIVVGVGGSGDYLTDRSHNFNNQYPSEFLISDPSLIINTPLQLSSPIVQWQEVSL